MQTQEVVGHGDCVCQPDRHDRFYQFTKAVQRANGYAWACELYCDADEGEVPASLRHMLHRGRTVWAGGMEPEMAVVAAVCKARLVELGVEP